MSLENEIRDLAYSKWEVAGCPETTIEERNQFWYEAEQQVLSRCANKIFTPIPGAECLGEIDDATYFKNKLLQGMNYPPLEIVVPEISQESLDQISVVLEKVWPISEEDRIKFLSEDNKTDHQ